MPALLDYVVDFEKACEVEKRCQYLGQVGNGCYENPSASDVCRGTKELLEQATHAIKNGTTVYLYRCPPDFY